MSATTVPLIAPVLTLSGWTLVMEAWMYVYRVPDLSRYKVQVSPNMTIESMNRNIPRHRQWPADNYNHLALSLTFLEATDSTTVGLAWAYVGVRIAHSMVQASANIVPLRFFLFLLSSFLLLGLTAKAGYIATA